MRKFKFLSVIVSFMMFLCMLTGCSFGTGSKHVCESKCEVCEKCADLECEKAACKEKCECETEHTCENKCEVCEKCTNAECEEEACVDKCECEEPAPEHTCESVCEECGGCLDVDCEEAACETKCECEAETEHTCESVCEECGGCLNADCEEEACLEKCECEEPAPEHTCQNKCPTCEKCENLECEEEACLEKCECEAEEPAPEHTCQNKCQVCQKCTNAECEEEACLEKCECEAEEPAPEHTCESVCPTCEKCENLECEEEACADKCFGHIAGEHICESKCSTCRKCTDIFCTEEACQEKCPRTGYVDIGSEDSSAGHMHLLCETCQLCRNETCAQENCVDKCQGHTGYIDYQKEVFKDKRALFIGDSICAATSRNETNTEHRGWPGRIEYSTAMDCVNEGVSGASLSTIGPDGGASTKRILTQYMGVKDQDFDFIIMQGGINDAMGSAEVGSITTSFNVEDFDINTYAGALEELFYHVTQNHSNAKLGYIFTFKTPNLHRGRVDYMMEYYDAAKQICEKWNVPFLNLYEDEDLGKELKIDTNENLPDWLHPNTTGYDVLYKYIIYWMETLPVYSEIEEGYELESFTKQDMTNVPEIGCSGEWTDFY